MIAAPTSGNIGGRIARVVVLLLVCALGGAFNVLNTNFSQWASRLASFPEEEETHAKDRSALVSAGQPSRRGSWRPNKPHQGAESKCCHRHADALLYSLAVTDPKQTLLGAGIFQLC